MIMTITEDVERKALQAKLDKMATDLEEVRLLNSHFQEDQLLQLSHQKQTETVCEQVRDKIGDFIKGVFSKFQDLDFSFLEMNPFTLVDGEPYP
ncbi:hypothetical protein EV2_022224 [Malus domestica]|uniref:ATP citrate synthase n=1 Tax=Malus domestica TaxID=3750 RepID=A0A498HPA3_MALDO|nr:hypothetical protein DVH24_025233 [Malus domestica]